ncbi:helix-turn-helix transcriptional regulator [Streptomyces sp. WMMC500]|uniref:helix-turn-helix domain-containing protein n=1 Tax=Streptomyces sp. WMMC500 TaxID=3015154 RepID=UPI00248B082C|nr:helix-turn-helix transcriptional regulator [Streptomyces sp. WMMC500]WBB62132.1 helix-turn-helix transcriptional regulator [Streptomyces sp. WMMC500]
MPQPPRELTPFRSNRDFYGAELRRLRTETRLSLEELSGQVPASRAHLSRVETAQVLPPPGLSASLDQFFDTGGHFARLDELVRQSLEIHPAQFRRRMELERRARLIRQYAGMIVPGLLQTAAYARAIFRAYSPDAAPEEIEDKVAARLSRQALLHADTPPDYACVIDEAVLVRPVGGPAVMREQLARLADAVDTPSTTVQLLPGAHGEHALMGGGLTLLTLDTGLLVAYEEGIEIGTLFEGPAGVTARQRAYDLVRSYALSPSQTAAFMRSAMEELPNDHHS